MEDAYNCEKLTKEFAHLQGTKQEMNSMVHTLFHRKNMPRKYLYKQVAALICFGANPNGISYTSPLHNAVVNDNVEMVSFLLNHKAHIDIKNNLHFKIRSFAMAQKLAPYLNIETKSKEDRGFSHYYEETIVHKLTNEPASDLDLLNYYVEQSDLANIKDTYGELPLHTLADNCSRHTKDVMRKKASLLIKKTKNINARDNSGYTPLDKALQMPSTPIFWSGFSSCGELIKMLKEHGGKSTTQNM